MKIDLVGQAILGLLFILAAALLAGDARIGLLLLLIWQLGSAAYVWLQYRYQQRSLVFWILLFATLVLAVPPFLPVLPWWLLVIPAIWYLILTIRDTIRVYRRPRSFWDLD